jgi:hypothetical protein
VDAFSQNWAGSVNLLVPPMGAYARTIQHLVECAATGVLVAPSWDAQEWWPMLRMITTRMLVLGAASEVAVRGPSGRFEPGRNRNWTWSAFWVDGARWTGWRS